MIRFVPFAAALSLGVCMFCTGALAARTPSGTLVSNVASLQYVQAGVDLRLTSNAATFRVLEVLDVVVQKSDAGYVGAASPDTRRVLTFRVTNTGNGSQPFRLSTVGSLAGDQFDPAALRIALDTDGNGTYEPGIDVDYLPGTGDPTIAPDQTRTVFVLGDIPAGRSNNDLGLVALNAQAVIGTGAPGSILSARGAGGIDVVIGVSRGVAEARNGYQVAQLQPVLTKNQTVANPSGDSAARPGSIVTYLLRLDLQGIGSAFDGTVFDGVPANATYVAGSLRLDGVALSDQADADAGRFTGNGIEVRFGALAAPAKHEVSFQVRLN